MIETFPAEVERILRERKISPDQVLHRRLHDLRIEMILQGGRKWDIIPVTEESLSLFFAPASPEEQREGAALVTRPLKAILYESDDTEEPRYLLATPKITQKKLSHPAALVVRLAIDMDMCREDQIGSEAAVQADKDGYDEETPVIALRIDKVLYDEDPRSEDKQRLYEEEIPSSIYGDITPEIELSPEGRAKLHALKIPEDSLLHIRLAAEEIRRIRRGDASGIFFDPDSDSMEEYMESGSDTSTLLGDDTDVVAQLVDEQAGEELLVKLVPLPIFDGLPNLILYDHSRSCPSHYAMLLMSTKDAEYILSRGFHEEDTFYYIPVQEII